MSERIVSKDEQNQRAPKGLHCDFCGQETTTVRRIALDRGYERLRTPHVERYACAGCSAKKERERRGLAPR
ncbi:MAG TPA: hypothetical protein VKE73_16675 [Myxococcota bacterium]|nr:hypothetical protein [Myxococcota bacterium]